MAERVPCPRCGATDTMESLTDELRAVRKKVVDISKKNGSSPSVDTTAGQVFVFGAGWVDPEPMLRLTYEVCAECGVVYDPKVQERAADLRVKIADAMKLIPLDLVAEAAQEQRQ